jgi:hypothetical protein
MSNQTQNQTYALKGNLAVRLYGTYGVYEDLGNATDAKISIASEVLKQKSNGDEGGTLGETEFNRESSFEATLQSRHSANLKRAYAANSLDVSAVTVPVDFTLPAGVAGNVANLGKSNITAVNFGTLVEGVDFTLKPKSGGIVYLTTIDETPGTFTHGKFSALGLASATLLEWEVLYTSETGATAIELFRWKPSPAQVMQLISDGASFGTFTLTGGLLSVTGAVADPTLGKVGRIRTLS